MKVVIASLFLSKNTPFTGDLEEQAACHPGMRLAHEFDMANPDLKAKVVAEFFSDTAHPEFVARAPLSAFFSRLAFAIFMLVFSPFLLLLPLASHPEVQVTAGVFLSFYLATRLRAISLILHDLSHNAFSCSSKTTILLGEVLSAIVGSDFQTYRLIHLDHHANLGEANTDRDISYDLLRLNDGLRTERLMPIFRFYFVLPLGGNAKQQILHIGFLSALVFLHIQFLGWASALYLDALCVLAFYPIVRIIGDWFDHGAFIDREEVGRSRNNPSAGVLRRHLFFSNNDQFHLLHHLLPSIPSYRLPAAHQFLLSRSDTYRQMIAEES